MDWERCEVGLRKPVRLPLTSLRLEVIDAGGFQTKHSTCSSYCLYIVIAVMSLSSRPAMRLLSTRLVQLQRAPATKLCTSQIRHASRYSAPTKRAYTAAPAQESYFVNPSGEDAEFRHPTDPPRNPLDARAVQEANEEKRQYHLRRMRFAGMPTTSASSESLPMARIAMLRRIWRKKIQSSTASAAAQPTMINCASVV